MNCYETTPFTWLRPVARVSSKVGESREGREGDHMHLSVVSHGVLLLDSAPQTHSVPFFPDCINTTP